MSGLSVSGSAVSAVPVDAAVLRWTGEAEADGLLAPYVADGRLVLPDTMAGCADVAAAVSHVLRVLGSPCSGSAQQQAAHDGLSAVFVSVMRRVLDATKRGAVSVPVRRFRSPVHGVTFRAAYPDCVYAADGVIGELVPEPHNPHDLLAVRVDAWGVDGTVDLGYLPSRRDDVRRELHAFAADRDVLGELTVRTHPRHPDRPGVDVTFDLPYDMDLFLRLFTESEMALDSPVSVTGADAVAAA